MKKDQLIIIASLLLLVVLINFNAIVIAFTGPTESPTGGSGIISVDVNDNVGLGAKNPARKLDIASPLNVDGAFPELILKTGSNSISANEIIGSFLFGGYDRTPSGPNQENNPQIGAKIDAIADTSWQNGTAGTDLVFYTAPNSGVLTERLRIDSSGSVGIGKNPTTKLDIEGDIKVNETLILDPASEASANATEGALFYDNTANTLKYHNGANWQTHVNMATMIINFNSPETGDYIIVDLTQNPPIATIHDVTDNGGNGIDISMSSPVSTGVFSNSKAIFSSVSIEALAEDNGGSPKTAWHDLEVTYPAGEVRIDIGPNTAVVENHPSSFIKIRLTALQF